MKVHGRVMALRLSLMVVVLTMDASADTSLPEIKGVNCTYTSRDFWFRAIARVELEVLYYSSDHSNVLAGSSLSEIHSIEQEIKSWPGYSNHSLIYKGSWDDALYPLLGGNGQNYYCEAVPFSPLNFMFPELYDSGSNESVWLWTGDGDTFYQQYTKWLDYDHDGGFGSMEELGRALWFNRDTFTEDNSYESPFVAAVYPFSSGGWEDTKAVSFVESYHELLASISSESIELSWFIRKSWSDSNDSDIRYINGKEYVKQSPAANATGNDSADANWCTRPDIYYRGYSTTLRGSSGTIQVIDNADEDTTTSQALPTSAPTTACVPTVHYVASDNADSKLYYDDRWRLVDQGNEYYCNVLLSDVSMCDGQWQSSVDGEYVEVCIADSDESACKAHCTRCYVLLASFLLFLW